MLLNFASLISTLVFPDNSTRQPYPPRHNPYTKNSKTWHYYIYDKRGHLAHNYLTKYPNQSNYNRFNRPENRRVNIAWINDKHLYSKEQVNSEVKDCHQPYNKDYKAYRKGVTEPQEEYNLKYCTKPSLIQVDTKVAKLTPVKKLRMRRQLSTVIPTIYLDNQPLVDNSEESDSLDDLVDELEFKKEELLELKIYYLEELELDSIRVGKSLDHLDEENMTIVNALLEINKGIFAENIAEEAKPIKQTYYYTSKNKQEFLFREVIIIKKKDVVRKCKSSL
ncbi:7113_t:CDS:2 [Dentiscutata heterogama]|uniref:7113_t:CDS:1 n=1 Tax=Dentiscutata heterogama TaxID=1316150 RepID=A0ACA9KWW0_9GLOM|nr:7113_t:CDS:2 [Dentiscutata heterogama]